MNTQYSHRFSLEKIRQRKFRCPSCGQPKVFVRYVDTANGQYLPDDVGRCDREINCGYHKKPKEHFNQYPGIVPASHYKPIPEPVRHVEYFTRDLLENSLKRAGNHFLTYLTGLFGLDIALDLQKKYFIGTSSSRWPAATVFWQIDEMERVRYGKVMLYDPLTGKRVKEHFSHITAVHTLIGRNDMNYQQCFFGQHLIKDNPNKDIRIVEAEKTAAIASVFKPERNWLATGGSNGLKITKETVQCLKNKNIVMFPDAGFYDKWVEKAAKIKSFVNCRIKVSKSLEGCPENTDLADYLIQTDESGLAIKDGYPVMWDYKKEYQNI